MYGTSSKCIGENVGLLFVVCKNGISHKLIECAPNRKSDLKKKMMLQADIYENVTLDSCQLETRTFLVCVACCAMCASSVD